MSIAYGYLPLRDTHDHLLGQTFSDLSFLLQVGTACLNARPGCHLTFISHCLVLQSREYAFSFS